MFGHAQGGVRETVHPGNQDYIRGDRIARPKGGGGAGGGSQASASGEGEDDFVLHLTKEEFMQVFFEALALPTLARTQLGNEGRVVAPPTRTPPASDRMHVKTCTDMDEGLKDADVVMMLRLQNERMDGA